MNSSYPHRCTHTELSYRLIRSQTLHRMRLYTTPPTVFKIHPLKQGAALKQAQIAGVQHKITLKQNYINNSCYQTAVQNSCRDIQLSQKDAFNINRATQILHHITLLWYYCVYLFFVVTVKLVGQSFQSFV